MRAIDTNIVVRLFANNPEDPQFAVAKAIIDAPFLVVPTVFLEAEWVLRSAYKLTPKQISSDLLAFCRLPHAVIVAPRAVRAAIEALEAGADFGDALHAFLAAEAGATEFATFDKSVSAQLPDLTIVVETLA